MRVETLKGRHEASKDRVQEICTRLNFSSKLLRRLEQDWSNVNKEWEGKRPRMKLK